MTKTMKEFEDSNKRLFDLLLRHQLFLEGLKDGLSSNYTKMLKLLYVSFASFLMNFRYATLDQLTRVQLIAFQRQFQLEQTKHYNIYVNELVKELKAFLAVDVDLSHSIYSDVKQEENTPVVPASAIKGTAAGNKELWDLIDQEPMPANGQFPTENLKAFVAGAMNNVLAVVRQGYANGWTPQETLQVLGGTDSNFKGGLFNRLNNQNAALVATLVQNLSTGIQEGVGSAYFKKYQWVATLENTCKICLALNGLIFIYGEGPLPPRHMRCRCKPVAFDGNPVALPTDYISWLEKQPPSFQEQILGSSQAAMLRSGTLTADTFRNIGTLKPLTVDEFAAKLKYILM